MKFLSRVFIISLLFSPFVVRAAETPLSLPDLLLQAQEQNPEVLSAYQKWQVAEKDAGASSSWPNPSLKYVDEKDPMGVDGSELLSRKHYGVEQAVPFPGKLTNEQKMKHHEALINEAEYRSTLLDIRRQIKIAVYRLIKTDLQTALAKQNVEAMRLTLAATEARLASNRGPASDAWMSRMELGRMENMVYEKERERRGIEIELNTLLNKPLDQTWTFKASLPRLASGPLSMDVYQSSAEMTNPLFQTAHHEINHGQAMKARSRLEYAPDFGFMYEYQTAGPGAHGTGPAGRQLGVSMSVPFWLKRPINLNAGSRAHVQEVESKAVAMENMVRKMVAMEYTEVVTHSTLAKKIEDEILPAADAAFNSARAQYSAGRGDYLHFLEASRSWFAVRTEYEEQRYHTVEHWSELERWVGMDLDGLSEEKNEK